MRWLIATIVVIAILACFFVWKNIRMPKTASLLNGHLQPCPSSPNCVCSCASDPVHAIAPLPLSSASTLDQIEAYLRQHYIVQVVQKTPDYLHVVITTSKMRFKDDVEFLVNRQQKVIDVRSASRLGYSDMGVNRARIEALRTFLQSS